MGLELDQIHEGIPDGNVTEPEVLQAPRRQAQARLTRRWTESRESRRETKPEGFETSEWRPQGD